MFAHKLSHLHNLLPLPVPSQPWEQISLDFVTDLPSSSNNTTIWVVVDRYSKMVHFVPLPGLPSAEALAEHFFREIFHLHGMPSHIISDRGVQFTFRFWKTLKQSWGITLNLSPAFHPQTNGQTVRIL